MHKWWYYHDAWWYYHIILVYVLLLLMNKNIGLQHMLVVQHMSVSKTYWIRWKSKTRTVSSRAKVNWVFSDAVRKSKFFSLSLIFYMHPRTTKHVIFKLKFIQCFCLTVSAFNICSFIIKTFGLNRHFRFYC